MYVEYGGRHTSHTPEALDSSLWPTKDLRVPISQVLGEPVDTSRYAQYGMDELSPVTQQPRLSPVHLSPAKRAAAAAARRQSQPNILPGGDRLVKAQSASPIMGRRVSQPVIRQTSQQPYASPAHSAISALGDGTPQRGRRRSVQMTSLHQDFYSDSEEEGSLLDEIEEEEGVLSMRTDITASDYETSVTSNEEEEEEEDDVSLWEDAGVSRPLLSLPSGSAVREKKPCPPKHSSTIPQIVVTEPFEIGPNPTLQFSIYYDRKRRTLIVHLQKGFNLPARQIDSDICNPFVIVYLLPNRETDRETYESRVMHNTFNPNFDEMFQFPRLKEEVARQQTLVFRIYHQCGPQHNILIGGVLQPLEGVDFSGKTLRNRIIEDVEESQVYKLDISFVDFINGFPVKWYLIWLLANNYANWQAKQAYLVVRCAGFFCSTYYIYISLYHGRCHAILSNLAINMHNFVPISDTRINCAASQQCIAFIWRAE